MPPVHADEGDGAVLGGTGGIAERLLQEAGELLPAHLARGEGEVAMVDGAETADMAVDRHVVGRVGEDEVCRLSGHQAGDVLR